MPNILYKLKVHWSPCGSNPVTVMLWAAATLCFFGFFRAGEITVPSLTAFDKKKHLAWGDVAVDNPVSPQAFQVYLKFPKQINLEKE